MNGNIYFGICLLAISMQSASAADPDNLLSRADHLAELGNSVKARPLYAQAEKEFHARGDTRNELYAKFGRLRRDVERGSYSTVAEEVQADLQNPVVQNDPALKIRALSLKGVIDLNLNTAAAQDDYSQMQAFAKAIGDRKWENRASGELGIIAGVNGDIRTAATALLRAISTAAALNDVSAQISFTTWLANGMTAQGMADGAMPFLDRALSLATKDPDAGFPVQLYIAKIRALVTLGSANRSDGFNAAKSLLETALEYSRENGILGAQSELLNQAGLLAMNAHDLTEAERYFRRTVDAAERADLPRMEAEGFLHLSDVYQERKELAHAVSAVDSAIEQVRQVQEDFDLPVYLARKADLEADRGNLRQADVLYDQASDMVEAMLINAPTSRHKISMIAALSDIYVGHFRLAVSQLHDTAKAFRIIEAARARALADSIRYARQSPGSSRTSTTELQIATLQKQLREVPVSPTETKLLLTKLNRAYEQLTPIEYERSRAEIMMARRDPVSIPKLQRSLGQREVLVEYVLDNAKNSYALEISRTSIQVHTLPPRAEVNDLCQNFLRALKAKKNWSEPGRILFERVVQPAMSDHPLSVVIVPDGPLNLIPFASLPDKTGQHLARSTIVSLAPSATVFEVLRTTKRQSEPRKSFLGIAYSPGGPGGGAIAQYSALRGIESDLAKLKPLPFAREEVQAGARIAGEGSVALLDNAATESALKAEPLGDFKVIHLAMHGFGDNADPDRAGLVLAPGDSREDGLWQAREIQESRLAADLVTLSACETGVGRLQGEEGIMNLARTFLVAGARSVVASLWDADDRTTATLMTHFYREIGNGRSVAEALRNAQLSMLSEFGSDMQPYFWAGFTVIGDGNRKINFTKTKSPVEQSASVNIR